MTDDVSGLPLCDICVNGCGCNPGQPGCQHFACWGAVTGADATCPGAAREQVRLEAFTRADDARTRTRWTLFEVLRPTLDHLCDDLLEMNARADVDLNTWPAARALVRIWRHEAPQLGEL